jgi:hypothetical protein
MKAPATNSVVDPAILAKGKEIENSRSRKPEDNPHSPARIREAFLQAQKELGQKWKLKYRGHDSRMTVNLRVGRIIGGLGLVRARVKVLSWHTFYPTAVVERAASILCVPVSVFTVQKHRDGERP